MFRIDIDTATTAHIIYRGQIPLFDVLTRAGIVKYLTEQIALLYGKDFHSRTFGVYVGHVETVAMLYTGTVDHSFDRIYSKSALKHFIYSVAIGIRYAQLLKLGSMRLFVIAAPCITMPPSCGTSAGPVIPPCQHVIMMTVRLASVICFDSQ